MAHNASAMRRGGLLPDVESGRSEASRLPSPLRTVLASFPAHGSSILNADGCHQRGSLFLILMNLYVTNRM